jgi:hypothetical protein
MQPCCSECYNKTLWSVAHHSSQLGRKPWVLHMSAPNSIPRPGALLSLSFRERPPIYASRIRESSLSSDSSGKRKDVLSILHTHFASTPLGFLILDTGFHMAFRAASSTGSMACAHASVACHRIDECLASAFHQCILSSFCESACPRRTSSGRMR